MKHQSLHTLEYLQESFNQAFSQIHEDRQPPELYDPIRYALSRGGKHMRPALVLLACDMFGGNIEDAVDPAIGIELFHNFTLIHDDIMDQAPLRRGQETVYKKWNSNIAILAGDTVFARANLFILATRSNSTTAIARLFNRTAVEVCEGQQYDMNFERRARVTIEEYIEMIRLKTAVLLAASLETGALVAGAAEKDAEVLYDFGIRLGIAFQLKDDLLDVYGSEAKFGKVNGGDIISCKKTFLYLKALELLADRQDELARVYNTLDLEKEKKLKAVKDIFNSIEIQKITQAEIDKYFNEALQVLTSLEIPKTYKRTLLQYTLELMNRDK